MLWKLFALGLLVAATGSQEWQIGHRAFFTPAGTLTLGSTATGNTGGCGYQGICETPILFNAGTGYTLQSFTINVAASSGQILLGIYGSGTASCPSGASFCANTLLCSAAAFTPTVGVNTVAASSFSSCGTFSPSQYYYLVVETASSSTTFATSPVGYCAGTGYFQLSGPSQASFALPATMGAQTEPSANECPAMSATFSCSGGCGAVAVPWAVFTYAGNTSGTAVTTTNLVTGASGLNGAMGGTLTSATTYANTPVQGLRNSVNINGTTYSGGTLSISRATTDTDNWSYGISGGAGGASSAVMLMWLYNTGNSEVSGDQFDLGELGGANIITFGAYGGSANCTPAASPCFRVERSGGTTAFYGAIPFSQSTWYALVLWNISGGTHEAAVYDTTGTQIATQASACADNKTICIPSDVSGWPNVIRLGCDGSCATDAGTWYYGPVLFDPTGTTFSTIGSTYGNLIFPDSPQQIGPVLSAQVRAGQIPHAVRVSGGWYSYALHRKLEDKI